MDAGGLHDLFQPHGHYLGQVGQTPHGFALTPHPVIRGATAWSVLREDQGLQRVGRSLVVGRGGVPGEPGWFQRVSPPMAHPSPLLDPRFLRLRALLDPVPSDPVDPHAPPGWEGRAPGEPSTGSLRAAVALVLREASELEVLLIKRAISERDPWSGHMAFPGGRFSREDPSLLITAVRETAEETGISLDPVERLLGALKPVSPVNRRLPPLVISPFVFAAEEGATVVPDPREVESALWVPLRHLADPGSRVVVDIPLPEGPVPFPAFQVGEHRVWGLTYRILDHFLRRTRE